ncbi:MAG TPA: sugar transferase [Anaerolineae bacterium]|nr:sugar transferase [Anaerolineae bacterium]
MTWQWRVVDVASAGLGLVVLSPLLAIVGLLIKLDSPGPVLHRSVRIGKYGTPFRIYKFRTMVADAAQRGAGITSRDDPRITRIGKILRRTKMDELPQLINVLRGEMSLVGPRPEDPRYIQYYTPAQRAVLDVLPGITSAASLAFRHEEQMLSGADWEQTYIDSVLPQKLDIELAYLRRRTFWSDLGIMAQTARAVLNGGNGNDAT